MQPLTSMINIGKTLETKLNHVGIVSAADLNDIGSRRAFIRIFEVDSRACLNTLFGLESGGIENQELREFYDCLKRRSWIEL